MGKIHLDVFTSVLPASIYCAVFGYNTCEFRNKTVSKLYKIYCFLIFVCVIVASIVVSVTKLCTIEVNIISVLFLVSHSAFIVVLSYYSIVFLTAENVYKNILNNLNYADKCLDLMGVKVPHLKYHVTCYLYVISAMCIRLYMTHLFLDNLASARTQLEVLIEFRSLYETYLRIMLFYLLVGFELYLNCILYAITQRLAILRDAILSFRCRRRNIISAWCEVAMLRPSVDSHMLLLTYNSLCQSYHNTKHLFNNFVRLWLLQSILLPSLFFLSNTPEINGIINFIIFITSTIGIQMFPLWIIVCITHEIRNVGNLIYNMYYDCRFSQIETAVKAWTLRSLSTEVRFDCGYFTVDTSLCSLVFNFTTLFVLAMM